MDPDRGLPLTAESDAIEHIGRQIPSRRHELDGECRFPSDLYAEMIAAGLYDQLRTRELGGCSGLTDWLHNGIHAAWWDGSFGWLATQGPTMLGFLSINAPDLARRVYQPRHFSAAATNAGGLALRVVHDTTIVKGTIPFTSGCDNATGIIALGFPADKPPGPDTATYVYAAADSWEIVRDWDVVGLRGTGSHSLRVNELRIPTCDTFPAETAQLSDDPLRPIVSSVGGAWRISYSVAATQLGVARRALDEAYQLAAIKAPRPGTDLLKDRPVVRERLMELEASWHHSLAGLERNLDGLWTTSLAGEDPTNKQRALLAMAALTANRTSVDIIDGIWRIVGTSALSPDHPVARCAADIRPLIGHISCNDAIAGYAATRWQDQEPGNNIV